MSAVNVRHELQLDRVLLVVNNVPWQKAGTRTVSPAEQRLGMVAAAVADVEGLEASRVEIDAGGPSYTADTLAALLDDDPTRELYVILGADAVANMIVRLAPIGSESLPAGGEAATTVTTADGAFTLLRVPHGQYTLIASRSYAYLSDGDGRVLPRPPALREGWSGGGTIPGADVGYGYVNSEPVATHTARQPLSVGGESIAGLTVQLRPNVRLRGRVVIESGAFVLSGASGGIAPPSANGPVTAEPANGDLALGMPGGTFDSAAGTFFVDGLQPGEYVLRFTGLPTIKSITVGGADFTTRPIDTSNAAGLDQIVVTVTDKVATLSGVVQSDGAQPKPSVVLYFPTDRAQWSRYGLRPTRIGSAPVTNNGGFKVDLPAGEYFVLAVPAAQNRLWQDPNRLAAASVLATRVRLGWDEKRAETLTMKEVK